MRLKSVREVVINAQPVLMRVDFNVPLTGDGAIASDWRIRQALPTIEHVLERDANPVLMAHLGRPGGERRTGLTLDAVARRLDELLADATLRKLDDVVGPEVRSVAEELGPGEVLLIENLRFHPGEEQADDDFAARLRALGEIYVNDAFAASHRRHASTYGAPRLFPAGRRVIGLLMERELRVLDHVLERPERPVLVLLGGAEVSDKLGVIEALLERVDRILIGGAMAYPFMAARGQPVGASRVGGGQLALARRLLARAEGKIELPMDHRVASTPEGDGAKVVASIPEGWYGLDIGPDTTDRYRAAFGEARTVLWSGPMGKFELEPFREGTCTLARTLGEMHIITIAGGGETVEVIEELGLVDQLSHVSTGGGAFLEYLRAGSLPALEVLDRR